MLFTRSKALTFGTVMMGFLNAGSAFVMTAWENPDCTGTARSINVWDNSCKEFGTGFAAFTLDVYGGSDQKAYISRASGCNIAEADMSGYVDGEAKGFQLGVCNSEGVG
ncbi:uncharacterized protein Z520_08142 [Fonsecaea multimorphosa CBS 102226]|uniref:Uncharacterized protein n=1 Tax=Fonsecaea multimorphosa CBS 102226 TaxID=1442371 RepID=A0A0D2K0E8_9EURO|nr:uncharacterized protein Z520_08142 [Fonsecaea multimorphosa CBS 102226]KIX96364.1 hypothetical protein Z520_08142 [Fonsecaea multimorphosa CBS 102226]OAL22023.1 hypothetical protein AYO22_07620 [Fonsecaea multimorphosa]